MYNYYDSTVCFHVDTSGVLQKNYLIFLLQKEV